MLQLCMPLVLLRNTNHRKGICNGTIVMFDRDTTINNNLLRCTITGITKQVLILTITFRPKTENLSSCAAGASSRSHLHSPPQSTRPKTYSQVRGNMAARTSIRSCARYVASFKVGAPFQLKSTEKFSVINSFNTRGKNVFLLQTYGMVWYGVYSFNISVHRT